MRFFVECAYFPEAKTSISIGKKRDALNEKWLYLLNIIKQGISFMTAISLLQTKCLTFGLPRDILLTARNHLSASSIIEKRIFHPVVVWYSVVHDGTNTRVRYAQLWNFKHCFPF